VGEPTLNLIEKYDMSKEITKVKPVTNLTLEEPPQYNVIYINDNVTTMEFVIQSLILIFNHTEESATELTMTIHENGSGVAATLPYEMAEQKGVEATQMARNQGFPLVIKLEANT
jgi:ATP-dependent Clp protease adaptor protein ClpS